MQRPKLTKAQVEAIKEALDNYYGDTEKLINHHQMLARSGEQWTTWPVLNSLTTEELKQALKFGFEKEKLQIKEGSKIRTLNNYYGIPEYKEGVITKIDWEEQYFIVEFVIRKKIVVKRSFYFNTQGEKWELVGESVESNAGGGAMRKVRIKLLSGQEQKLALELELDYWLASLHDAQTNNQSKEVETCIEKLKEIHGELMTFN